MKTLLYSLLALAVAAITFGVAGSLLAIDSVRSNYNGTHFVVRLNCGPYSELDIGRDESGEFGVLPVRR